MAITDHAGKLGIKVEVVSADHQNKPDIGSSIARGWYDIAAVQNVKIVTGFYWDRTGESRAFAMRFSALHPRKAQPNDMHAGMYAATLHLMKAYAPLKSAADGKALVDAMKAMPTDDPLYGKGSIRVDGRKLHPMYLLATKTVAESKNDWDSFNVVRTMAVEDAWRPLAEGGCACAKG